MKPTAIKFKFQAILGLGMLLSAVAATGSLFAADHQKMAEEAGCFTCHYMPPEAGQKATTAETRVDPRLKKGAGQWCVSCHAMESMTLHPTGVKVRPAVICRSRR